jgi:hypothetical protein
MSTTYSNTLQFASEWQFQINSIWMYHSGNSSDSNGVAYTNCNLVPDGPDYPVNGTSISSTSGVRDYWNVAFVDLWGNLYCTANSFHSDVPNNNSSQEIEFTFGYDSNGNPQLSITWQDGSSGGTFPMYLYGAFQESNPNQG